MHTLMITGSSGQVGWELMRQASILGFKVKGFNSQQLDIRDVKAVTDCVKKYSPALIINAAAYTAVDRAESETEQAFAVNAKGVENLAKAAKRQNIPLLHISTDYVFDGTKAGEYTEEDPVNPQSVYGTTKLSGEEYLNQILNEHIILRTSWVFGIHGNNFVKTMLLLGQERNSLSIVDDQVGRPTFAGDIASVLLTIAQKYFSGEPIPWGTYHFGGEPVCSWYEFAQSIFTQAERCGFIQKAPELSGIPTCEYPTPAKRPLNSAMSLKKIARHVEFSNHWEDGLAQILKNG